ncbi:MAG: PVC-type heme-binding CxxCH protein [Planctomycetia bacterium]
MPSVRLRLKPRSRFAIFAAVWCVAAGAHEVEVPGPADWAKAQAQARAARFLAPEEAVAAMTVPPGFRVDLFAAEPMISQPFAFCFDARGRMWIAENRDYESRGGGFSNDGRSRIVILEDTDRDGRADVRTVFLEGIPFPSAIAVGFGGLWLGAPPNLLFVPDRDGDDRADVESIEVRLTGWGIADRHETLNSFIWGPDGWLYGLQGFATPSKVGRPAGKGRIFRHGDPFPRQHEFAGASVTIDGGVWRYHPVKERFEVVAHGFSNPWGIDYDAKGQLFITACVIPHLWHVIPGGIYHRQGGSHLNPHVYADIRTIADHAHASAHGGARIYQSDAFPDPYRGRIFMANIHQHAILTDVLERKGSGYVGRHGDDFLLANNAHWVGFSIDVGPDGSVYALDWHDADICGATVMHPDTGRVYRIAATRPAAAAFPHRHTDLETLDDVALAEMQEAPSTWHATRARTILQHRAATRRRDAAGQPPVDPRAVERLARMFRDSADVDLRLRVLWALHVTDSIGRDSLLAALDDPEEFVRGWAVQLLCEDRDVTDTEAAALARLAERESSPVVRRHLASAIQRLAAGAAWPVIDALAAHAEDRADHNIPKLIWFGLEPLVLGDIERAARLATATDIPLLSRHVARRLAAAGRFEPLLGAIASAAAGRREEMLLGVRDAVDGRSDMQPPPGWEQARDRLVAFGGRTAAITAELSRQFGDAAALAALVGTLDRPDATATDRGQAIEALAARKSAALRGRIVRLFDDVAVRRQAIRAAAAYDEPAITAAMLDRWASFTDDERLEAVNTLASLPGHARALTDAIRAGRVARQHVPAHLARQLRRIVGPTFVDVWGPVDVLPADREAAFKKYRGLLSDAALAAGDPAKGAAVFGRVCAGCHVLHGKGGDVGPDLTGANRGNLEYLLGNILAPNDVIQDAYRMHVILLDDGRVYSGIPAEEDEQRIRLRVAQQPDTVAIPVARIESREIASTSLMPEGLLANLSDTDVVDLIRFLQSPAAPDAHHPGAKR